MSGVSARLARLPRRRDASTFLRHLRSRHRVSALRAAGDCVLVTITLKRRGVRPLLAVPKQTRRHDPDCSLEVSRAVDAGIALVPVAPTCLRRSVTLLRELGRLGLAAKLHVGVRTVAGQVEAHAWVQAGDVVLNDDPELIATYVELAVGDLETIMPRLT